MTFALNACLSPLKASILFYGMLCIDTIHLKADRKDVGVVGCIERSV